jgi:hypothetical protein
MGRMMGIIIIIIRGYEEDEVMGWDGMGRG